MSTDAPESGAPSLGSSLIMAPIRAARPVIIETRPRIAHGVDCMWWGAITDAHVESTPSGDITNLHTVAGLPSSFRCPHCGGRAEAHHTEESYLALARRFELLGFPRHQAMVRWVKGRCFKTRGEAWGAFAASGVSL